MVLELTLSRRPSHRQRSGVTVRDAEARPPLAGDQSHQLLTPIGRVSRYARHQTIFNEGDAARFQYRVLAGAVALSKFRCNGRRQIVEFLFAGDLFGFECGKEHSKTAESVCDAAVVRYPRARFDRLSEDHPAVREEVEANLHRELRAAQDHMMMLGRETAIERMASFLLAMSVRQRVRGRGALPLPMDRRDIADFLGLTIETVCRTLTDLVRAGLIEVPDRHAIAVRNRAKLELAACSADDEI